MRVYTFEHNSIDGHLECRSREDRIAAIKLRCMDFGIWAFVLDYIATAFACDKLDLLDDSQLRAVEAYLFRCSNFATWAN